MAGILKIFYKEESGQGLTEYSLILAFVALLLLGALSQLELGIMNSYQKVVNAFN
jgi:Flp pilus assembly pilin Flp